MNDFQNLVLETEGPVALLRIDRPKVLNALNAETLGELDSALSALDEDDRTRCLIVTGSGEKAFVAGADIRELSQLDPSQAYRLSARGQAVLSRIENLSKPVIAAVNGFCLGGGCELALACHIRIASDKARFGQPEVKLGLIPGYGGTQRLPRLVGRGPALEIMLSGEMVSAREALRIGLVNRVVPADELMTVSRALASAIAANAPQAVSYSLEAVRRGQDVPLDEALSLESALFGLSCATRDMQEGTAAFLEKRHPDFQGH